MNSRKTNGGKVNNFFKRAYILCFQVYDFLCKRCT